MDQTKQHQTGGVAAKRLAPTASIPLAPRGGAASLSTTTTTTTQLGTPPFFQTMAKRRGKWTAAEEEYALFMVKAFERGTLRECDNGITLRSFLSRKLHCAPMRISKKYAGM